MTTTVSVKLLLELPQLRCGPQVGTHYIQRCLDHAAHKQLTGYRASDFVRRDPVVEQNPGHLRAQISVLALLELHLGSLYHSFGGFIERWVVRMNHHPTDSVLGQELQVFGTGKSWAVV